MLTCTNSFLHNWLQLTPNHWSKSITYLFALKDFVKLRILIYYIFDVVVMMLNFQATDHDTKSGQFFQLSNYFVTLRNLIILNYETIEFSIALQLFCQIMKFDNFGIWSIRILSGGGNRQANTLIMLFLFKVIWVRFLVYPATSATTVQIPGTLRLIMWSAETVPRAIHCA